MVKKMFESIGCRCIVGKSTLLLVDQSFEIDNFNINIVTHRRVDKPDSPGNLPRYSNTEKTT